jgi:hypothetical protein
MKILISTLVISGTQICGACETLGIVHGNIIACYRLLGLPLGPEDGNSIYSSRTWVTMYQTSRRKRPEDSVLLNKMTWRSGTVSLHGAARDGFPYYIVIRL